MARRRRWYAPLVLGACLLDAASLAAQTRPTWPGRDAAVSFTEARDGIEGSSVYVVHRTADGVVRIGHDRGVSRYTGHRWMPDARFAAARGQVRTLLEADGWLWVGGRDGVLRVREDSSEAFDETTGGLPDRIVYALDSTRAFGRLTVVAATARGLARFSGRGFVPVPLPDGLAPTGLTVASTRGADGRTPTLWVASATEGIAHYTNGRWSVGTPADGLPLSRAEHLVAGATGSEVEVYAIGSEGVAARVNGRWRRVAVDVGSPYRGLELTRHDGRPELWIGGLDGQLRRRRANGTWEMVPVQRGRNPSAVQALAAVPSPTGEPSVFVGLRGDRLARVTLGPAEELEMGEFAGPRFLRGIALDTVNGRVEALWAGSIGRGVLRVTPTETRAFALADGLPDKNVFAVQPVRTNGTLEVWAGTGEGPVRWAGGRWIRALAGVSGQPVLVFAQVENARGGTDLFMGGYDGLHRWVAGRWARDTLMPPGIVSAVAAIAGPSGPQLWAAIPLGLFRRTPSAWVPERPFGDRTATFLGIRHGTLLHGDSALFAAGTIGMAWRRYSEPTWHAVTSTTHPALPDGPVYDVVTAADRVYAATPLGVLQFRWMGPDSLVIETTYGEADGLPSSEATSLAVGPDDRVYVATPRGLGQLPFAEAVSPGDGGVLLAWMRRGNAGTPVAADADLPPDVGVLEVELGLQTLHREADARYRVQLDGSGQPPTAWSSRTTYTFAALPPGRYVLRAWARDWRGRESALAPFAFRVRSPWWASWPALTAYLALLVSGLVFGTRARVRALKTRADELERNERRVAASERKFRALFDRAQDAHLLIERGAVVGFNDAARQLVGASGDLEARALLSPLAEAEAPDRLDDGARLIRRADGALVPAREVRTSIALEDRLLEHVVLRDVSAVRAARAQAGRLEDQLREAQKLESLGTLAGGVAHDFNNLLSVIRGNTELARALTATGATAEAELAEVLRTTDRARDLVQQILTFSRRSPSEKAAVDLAPLVHGLRGMLRATIPSTVELRINGPTEGCWVHGDATQLQQALLNLCTNAEYAMRATNGGRLSITIEAPGAAHARVVVRVADTGVGMSADVRARIFEPFFTTKPVGQGTGLGLSVLHGIVAAHGGTVQVESTEGAGTEVTLAFPAAVTPDVPPPPPTDRAMIEAPRGAGEHVLVVDDEPAIRTITLRVLSSLGYVVEGYEDPVRALARLQDPSARVDVLVTDQTMPGMTGDGLVAAARRARPGLPALIVTGYSHRLTSEVVASLGVPVLQKPVGLAELGEAVADVLGISSPGRSRA